MEFYIRMDDEKLKMDFKERNKSEYKVKIQNPTENKKAPKFSRNFSSQRHVLKC